MLFIEGPRSSATGDFITDIQNEYSSRYFMLRIIAYQIFFASNVGSLETVDCEEFVRFILQTARETLIKYVLSHWFEM